MSLEVRPEEIQGLLFIRMNFFRDERGFFVRNFCSDIVEDLGGESRVLQANLSFNVNQGTIRGFHFQNGGHEEAKTITVISGKLHYKVIDLRRNSPTYLKYTSFELNELENVVQVPRGCAPAFQTLEPNCLLHYYVSTRYSPEYEFGIRYDDPYFNMNWPRDVSTISKRDSSFEDFVPTSFEGLLGTLK